MKVRIAQIGARKGYAMVSVLSAAGCLESLCTDFYYRGRTMRTAAAVCDSFRMKRTSAALRARSDSSVSDGVVRTFPFLGMRNRLRVRRALGSGTAHVAYRLGGQAFAAQVARLPWSGVDVIYGFSSACLEAFEAAQKYGVSCVLDHETAPAAIESELVRRVEEQFERWLPYKLLASPSPGVAEYAERQRAEAAIASLVICPSTFSSKMTCQAGAAPEKVRCIPFAMGATFVRGTRRHDGPLHVLFAGNDAVRKGLPVLVEALRLLPHGSFKVRGAGNWQLSDYGWNACREVLEPMGPVPRSQMASLYQWADVMVLPTFSDTMGVVILEAMASGVPVIASESSGGPDLISEGRDGFVVPVNSPEAIAARLNELQANRDMLEEMGELAIRSANRFNLKSYGENVLASIQEFAIPRRDSDASA